ncbi:hypothetical protein [Leifsonia shinshuensis]|uniref:Lipoprotein n=1 Tax=Leifsonia shinshuensis TaxID=150026 RepID=A0A853CQX7_9MICO|nr:hypothetical protein [Leifsonia shinshuensis]NYJ23087.1 hypothetical protein [Leifsonia shinshuensis]
MALLATAALAGCAVSGVGAGQDGWAPSPSYSGPVPEFSGPWASEFAEAYRSTTSEVVHTILAKGSITDRDYASVSSAYVQCMSNKGLKAVVTGQFGESTVEGDGDVNAANEACSADFSVISALRYSTSRNPQHLDENEIVVACLIKAKVAPPSYTAKNYAADLETQDFPFSTSVAGFLSCTSDPLGLSTSQ